MTTRRLLSGSTGILGIAGSLTCTATMVVPAAGAAGAATMATMSDQDAGGLLGALIEFGPPILIAAIVLFAVSVTIRRPPAALPRHHRRRADVLGMYDQPSYPVMYITLAVGFSAWALTFLWARSARIREDAA